MDMCVTNHALACLSGCSYISLLFGIRKTVKSRLKLLPQNCPKIIPIYAAILHRSCVILLKVTLVWLFGSNGFVA